MFVALQKVETQECPITDLLEANIGYEHLKKLTESICCVPIATATVERSFSAMNRIMTKLRNRMGQDTLQYCMKISIEGDEYGVYRSGDRFICNKKKKSPYTL